MTIILGILVVGLLIYHIKRTHYYKQAINDLLHYIDEEEL